MSVGGGGYIERHSEVLQKSQLLLLPIQPQRLRVLMLQEQLQVAAHEHDVVLLTLIRERERQQGRRRRRWWVRPWMERRRLFGQYETLFQELERESRGDYVGYIRMDPKLFAELLLRVTPRITKGPRSRRPLKLAITLRFLATGNSYRSLAYNFRVAHNSISKFVPEVCTAIYEEYKEEMFTMPSTQDEWKAVARQFGTRWNFHHCCGAIDGKHIAIKKPKKSGSLYYNYKGFFSVVLLAIVDANYSFLWCKVGANGSSSDAGMFNQSTLRGALEDNTIGFPAPDPLPGDDRDFPFFIVGDDAFPLRKWLMKPYSRRAMTHKERVMNYRTSRARRVVENGFGILAHRWRCLLTTLQLEPGNVIRVVLGCLTLHNWLRKRRPGLQDLNVDREDEDGNVVLGAWREDVQMTEPNQMVGQRDSREGKTLRNYLVDYYSSPLGRLPWQDRVV